MRDYTVFAIYADNHQRFATTVTATSPDAAEAAAKREAVGHLIIAGVIEGRTPAVDEDPALKVGSVPGPAQLWVNVYSVTRHYGGPEEGGWWYNAGDVVASTPADNEDEANQLAATCREKFKDMEWGNIYSMSGGAQVQVLIENHPGEAWPTRTPHYE